MKKNILTVEDILTNFHRTPQLVASNDSGMKLFITPEGGHISVIHWEAPVYNGHSIETAIDYYNLYNKYENTQKIFRTISERNWFWILTHLKKIIKNDDMNDGDIEQAGIWHSILEQLHDEK